MFDTVGNPAVSANLVGLEELNRIMLSSRLAVPHVLRSKWAHAGANSVRATDDVAAERGNAPHCAACGFELWIPITRLSSSSVGLYNDGRFPGRVIVSADTHFEHFDDADTAFMSTFTQDIAQVSRVLRKMAGVERVNVSILGNKDPHLHAHVIPRRMTDTNYGLAPWDGAPPRFRMSDRAIADIVQELRSELGGVPYPVDLPRGSTSEE